MVKCVICSKILKNGDSVYNLILPNKEKVICCNYHMENDDLNKYVSRFSSKSDLPMNTVEVRKTPNEIIKELLEWLSEEHIGADETFLEQFPYVREWIEGEKMNELKCKCGNEMFNVATNSKFARCSKCGTVYDEFGKEVEIVKYFQITGAKVMKPSELRGE